eukprot:maker-scaffold849_size89187-snap-gene-0.16 protein:Tk02982 transcript:maker-scaffold849_size89187-snap-gene-0.16-mRNA-1 annotation:"hypothetical protein DAPPUDRAFT_23392"
MDPLAPSPASGRRSSLDPDATSRHSPHGETGASAGRPILSLAGVSAGKQEGATNGNHSPAGRLEEAGRKDQPPPWSRLNGFPSPAPGGRPAKTVNGIAESLMRSHSGLSESARAPSVLPGHRGVEAAVSVPTPPLSTSVDQPPPSGRTLAPVLADLDSMTGPLSRAAASLNSASLPADASNHLPDSGLAHGDSAVSPFLHIPIDSEGKSRLGPTVPLLEDPSMFPFTSKHKMPGVGGAPPGSNGAQPAGLSESGSDKNTMKACSVKLVDISGGMKKEPSPPPSRSLDAKTPVLSGGSVASCRDTLKRESPNSASRSSMEPLLKKSKEERLSPSVSSPVKTLPTTPSLNITSSTGKDRMSSSAELGGFKSKWQLDEIPNLPASSSTSGGGKESVSSPAKVSSSTIEGKVTISPVKKDPKMGSDKNSGGTGGSVTITKLSTGTSQRVDSKDLKTIIGGSGSNRQSRAPLENGHHNGELSGVKQPRKSPHSYSVEMQKKKEKKSASVSSASNSGSSTPSPTASSTSWSGPTKKPRNDLVCSSCNVEFSTREAQRLHTCNSKLDQHYLTEEQARVPEGKRGDKSTTNSPGTLSKNNSRSNSPTSQSALSGPSAPASTPTNSSHLISKPMNNFSCSTSGSNSRSNESEFKLVSTTADELKIEGRPKITVSKVTGSKNSDDTEARKPIIPKIKLSATAITNSKPLVGSSTSTLSAFDSSKLASSRDSHLETSSSSTSPSSASLAAANALKRKLCDPSSQAAATNGKAEKPNSTFNGKIKLKIPVSVTNQSPVSTPYPKHSEAMVTSSGNRESKGSSFGGLREPNGSSLSCPRDPSQSSNSIVHPPSGTKKQDEDSSGYPFAFAGRPTYSPSRIEPSTATVPEKESPRDASNKDSPASQADSGVFSIASSHSPSKGESGTSGKPPSSTNNAGLKLTTSQSSASPGSGVNNSLSHHATSFAPSASTPNPNSMANNSAFPTMGIQSASSAPPINQSGGSSQNPHQLQGTIPGQPQSNPYHNMYGDFNSQQPPHHQRDPSFNRQMNFTAHQRMFAEQQVQQRQGSEVPAPPTPTLSSKGMFAGQTFFNSSSEPPVKRKRGRPRKNPLKDPSAPKRTYNRKKKVTPTTEGSSDSVYNFDEEDQDGLQPMRPRKGPSHPAKKYSFGDDVAKGIKMGAMANRGGAMGHMMGPGYNSMHMNIQQQQYNAMLGRQPGLNPHLNHPQQQMQHHQQQSLPNDNSQDCSYSSEVLKEGVGIKLKIRKEPIKNENSNSNPPFMDPQQQQQQAQHQIRQQQALQHQSISDPGGVNAMKQNDPIFSAQSQANKMNFDHSRQQQHQMRMSAVSSAGMASHTASGAAMSNPMSGGAQVVTMASAPQPPPRMHNPGSVESNHAMSPSPMSQPSPYHHMHSPSNPQPPPPPHANMQHPMPSPSQAGGFNSHLGASPQAQHGSSNNGMSAAYGPGGPITHMQSQFGNGMAAPFPNGMMTPRYRMAGGGVPTSSFPDLTSEGGNHTPSFYNQQNSYSSPIGPMNGPTPMSGYPGMVNQRFGMNSMYPGNYMQQQMRQMNSGAQAAAGFGNDQYSGMYGNQSSQYSGMGFPNPRMGMMSQSQGGMMSGHGGSMGHGLHHSQFRPGMGMTSPGGMSPMGNVGAPRISPSNPNMHQPMPGVGMPRVSPSMSNRQPTPLVSPQSDHSPASHQSVNPHTPGTLPQPHTPSSNALQYGGPVTPVNSHNPMTPATTSNVLPPGSVSPMTPNNPRTPQSSFGPASQNPPSIVAPSPKQEPLMSPAPSYDDLASPNGTGPSHLRKIRRPSKPHTSEQSSISPRAEIKLEPPVVKTEDVKIEAKPRPPPPKPKQLGPKPQHKHLDIPAPIYEEKKAAVKVKKEIEKSDFVARWADLPDKALRHLFRCCVANEGAVLFLVRASRVCKSWNKQASDTRLWTHLDLSSSKMKEKYRNDKKLETFLRKYPNVLELKLTGWKNTVGTATLKMISTVCPKLVSLGLASCFKLSNEDVKLIAESYEKLERIDLSNVSSSSCSSRSAVSSTCLTEFVTLVGKRLTHFNISNNKMAGLPFVFKALSSHSSRLEELDISNITTTSREAIPMNVEKFQRGCPRIRVINANHTMLNLTETPIKEQIQSPGFPLLQELYIAVDSRGYFDGMDDGQIERILKKSDKLKLLDIRGCQHVSDSCLIRLPTWEMEKLVLSGCSAASVSSDGLELMVRKWAETLLEMDVSLTPGERTINYMVESFAEADITSVRKLNLCGTAIKPKSLVKLLKNCDTLEYINLNSCRGLHRGTKRLHGTREAVLKLLEDITTGKCTEDDSDD